ncbi:MAG TPA: hypothetical protein PK544_09140 [Spirochaetota bacterium]|nr:hypothetical protein [Spirochaetota bacterium]HPJ39251.1 hypothetical protein [Spirochaetota bacterium]HPQ52336.1 hypothetical protein [Spirochaetota bacterium]
MDKDLDRLLTDIEGKTEYDSSRAESLREKQKYARRSDSSVDYTDSDSGTGAAAAGPVERMPVSNDILFFDKGVLNALREHESFAFDFRKALSETDVSSDVDAILKKYNYTFVRFIENIEKYINAYTIKLNTDTLQKKAKKDFSLFFEGFEDENRLAFILLIEMFLVLREFNSLANKEWFELSKTVGVLNFASDGKLLYQSLYSIAVSAQAFCEKTGKFLRFLASVVGIPPDNFDVLEREIGSKTVYREGVMYDYGSLFGKKQDESPRTEPYLDISQAGGQDEDYSKESGTEDRYREHSEAPQEASTGNTIPESSDSGYTPRQGASHEKGSVSAVKFTVKGTRTWNTKEPYVVSLDNEKLQVETQDITQSFFFIDQPNNDDVIQGEIKRGMLKYLRDNSQNIQQGYCDFLAKQISLKTGEIADFFGFSDDRNLFIYHCGPFTVFRVLYSDFLLLKTGYCFKYLSGNRVSRFLPQEFIKEKVLEWFENNINMFDLPFDSISRYEDMRKAVTKRYYAEVDSNNNRLHEMIKKLHLDANPKFDRDDFFRSKWNEWFGAAQIQVYNRFVERTLFK